MKQDYLPLVVMIFLLPLFFSPFTIEGLVTEELQVSAIVQFDYPKNLADTKTDIETILEPQLESIINNMQNQTNATSFTLYNDLDHIVYYLEVYETSGNNLYELNPEFIFMLETNMTETSFNSEYNIMMLTLKNEMLDFLSSNNATYAKSYFDYTWGSAEVIETL